MAENMGLAHYEEMSPSLLAAQPAYPLSQQKTVQAKWPAMFRHLESRLSGLRNWRWTWWASWNVLAEFFIPRRYKWFIVANNMNRGRPLNDAIIDSTGQLAVRTCAAGLWSGLTNPARPWFHLEPALPGIELDAEAKDWLNDTENRLYSVLHQSNFYAIMSQAFQDVTVFGTAPVIIYEDSEDVIRCYLPCAGEYFLAAGGRLTVDTLYREFTLTVFQIVDMFGLENCPDEVVNMWTTGGGSLETELVVCHAIEPNTAINDRQGGRTRKRLDFIPPKFPFREIYWCKGKQASKPLSQRGFYDRPFFAARWSTVSNDAYGRSPCMDALGDTKQIQQETRRKAEFIEKGVRPPMGADPELKNEPASVMPGMITYMDSTNGKKGFFPLFELNPNWLPALTQDIEKVSERINRALFVDLFMAITRMQGVQPRNEMELTKRDLERLQEIGPFIDSFENEFAGPAIRRVLSIMERRNLLRPLPQSLRRTPIKINYASIMKVAQRSAEAIAMKDVLATAGNLSAAAKAASLPDPLRIVDLDKTIRQYAASQGFNEALLFTPQQVEENDAARAQGQEQANVLPTTMAGVQAAKTLSQTPVGGDSLLNSLLSGQTGPVG